MSGLQEKDLKTLLHMVDTTYSRRKTDKQKEDDLHTWMASFKGEDRDLVARAVENWISKEKYPPAPADIKRRVNLLKSAAAVQKMARGFTASGDSAEKAGRPYKADDGIFRKSDWPKYTPEGWSNRLVYWEGEKKSRREAWVKLRDSGAPREECRAAWKAYLEAGDYCEIVRQTLERIERATHRKYNKIMDEWEGGNK